VRGDTDGVGKGAAPTDHLLDEDQLLAWLAPVSIARATQKILATFESHALTQTAARLREFIDLL
jgi:hypothetical protein